MAASKRSRSKLSEELAELANPAPKDFDIEESSFVPAEVVRYDSEDRSQSFEEEIPSKLQIRAASNLSRLVEDPRYVGKVVSRKKTLGNVDSEEESLQSEEDAYVSGQFGQMYDAGIDQSDSSQAPDSEGEGDYDPERVNREEEEDPVSDMEAGPDETAVTSEASSIVLTNRDLQTEVNKGRAVRRQLSLWDGIVEGRIRLQKLLPLSNRLPQGRHLRLLCMAGGQKVEDGTARCEGQLMSLLDELLTLKAELLQKNEAILGGGSGHTLMTGTAPSQDHDCGDDEEVDSDAVDGVGSDEDEAEGNNHRHGNDGNGGDKSSRKRKQLVGKPWCLPKGKRRYEEYVEDLHRRSEGYRDSVIAKWSAKAQLSSGKLSSKSFIQSDNSVLAQIKHVLTDRGRLIRRTQLNRSNIQVIGKTRSSGVGVSSHHGGKNGSHRDSHLEARDEEMFDDSDFYHQILRDVIERKMSHKDTGDPTAMGRQWVAMQKLRTKVRKDVDTKASKARKIRFEVYKELVGFMAPRDQTGTGFTEDSKNDLFASLFGQQ